MRSISELPSPETPSAPTELPPPPTKRFGKKLYLAVALIAIVAVASVLTFIYIMPKGEGAPVQLSLNYTAGETMNYTMTMTASGMGQTVTVTGMTSIEILAFDGQNYTIRETVKVQGYTSQTFTFKMDKTGRIVDYGTMPSTTQDIMSSVSSMPGFGSQFPKPQVRVGENWQMPLNLTTSTYSIVGTANYKVSEIKDTTIPAGTFSSIKIEMTANNVLGTGQSGSTTVTMTVNLTGYTHLEKDTCRLLDCYVQESITATSQGQTMSMTMTMQMTLTQHTK